jgi:hypothetical protein
MTAFFGAWDYTLVATRCSKPIRVATRLPQDPSSANLRCLRRSTFNRKLKRRLDQDRHRRPATLELQPAQRGTPVLADKPCKQRLDE